MEHACLLQEPVRWIIDFGGILLATATAIVTIGYWFKPSFKISFDKRDISSDHIRVAVFNTNLFGNKIKDIDCELTLSEKDDFSGEVRTFDLIKPWIVCLKRKPAFYVFKVELDTATYKSNHIDGMDYMRVRLLAPNFLGVKKVKEVTFHI